MYDKIVYKFSYITKKKDYHDIYFNNFYLIFKINICFKFSHTLLRS